MLLYVDNFRVGVYNVSTPPTYGVDGQIYVTHP